MTEAPSRPEHWTPEDFEDCRRRALRGQPHDPKHQKDWLRAKMDLAWAYQNGYGTEPDSHRYFELLAQVAKLEVGSEIGARYHLAFAFRDGIGTEQNTESYLTWMRLAAADGDREAMFKLAEAYQDGFGVAADEKNYFYWIREMAEQGSPLAIIRLAEAYKTGTGTVANDQKYFESANRAMTLAQAALETQDTDVDLASEDLPLAIQLVSHAYRDGIGILQDNAQYFRYLLLAVEAADAAIIGFDPHEADQLADLRKTLAPLKRELAQAYLHGIGTQKDERRAFDYMRKAVVDGDPIAILQLGRFYEDGIGRNKSSRKAFECFSRAAGMGNTDAMYRAAISHGTRIGTAQSPNEFRRLAAAAVQAGHEKAFLLTELADLHCDGLLGPRQVSNLLQIIERFRDKVQKIKSSHVLSEADATAGVAHFTSLDALYSMLPATSTSGENTTRINRNHLRLYNIEYVNDPHEGKNLLSAASNSASAILKSFFSAPATAPDDPLHDPFDSLPLQGLAFSVYVGSFTLRADRLDLWRAYGGDGTGYCLVTPISAFRDPAMPTDHGFAGLAATDKGDRQVPMTLYRVAYGEPAVTCALTKLDPNLQELHTAIEKYATARHNGERIRAKIHLTARAILSDIMYLYKNAEYSTEEEVRMLAPYAISAEAVKADHQVPGRLYVDTRPFLFCPGSRIIIGPKVIRPEAVRLELRHRLDRNGHQDVDVMCSPIPYR